VCSAFSPLNKTEQGSEQARQKLVCSEIDHLNKTEQVFEQAATHRRATVPAGDYDDYRRHAQSPTP
jgi:hypothetical protein